MSDAVKEFSVQDYELEDSAVLTFKNKRGDDVLIGADKVNPAKARIYSPGSPQGVKAMHKAGRQSQLRLFRSMRGEFDAQDAANADRERAEKLAGFTAAFENFPVAPIDVYTNPRLCYMAAQVEEFIAKTGNF